MAIVGAGLVAVHLVDEFEDGSYPSLHLVHTRSVWMVVFRTRTSSTLTIDPVRQAVSPVDG